ncbi:MAG: hypothetical protein AAFW70_27185 [Cyanobacteria bacterium J06635_10]
MIIDRFHIYEGWFLSGQIGLASTKDRIATSQFDLVVGYRVRPRLALGASLGRHNNSTSLSVPVTTNGSPVDVLVENGFFSLTGYGKYYINDRLCRPYIYSHVGWGFALPNLTVVNPDGGLNAQAGLGVQFAARGKTRFSLQLGQYLQGIEQD